MKRILQKQLGELLIDSGLITQNQLEESLEEQVESGKLLGQILVAKGYVSEEAIAQTLTVQYGFPYLPLDNYEVDPKVAKMIPEAVAKQYGLIAVDFVGHTLTVAMSNPLNRQAIEDVEMLTHYGIQVFVSTATSITNAIKNIYKT